MKRNLWIETEDGSRLIRTDDIAECWIGDWKGGRPDPKTVVTSGREWYIHVTMSHGGSVRLTERPLNYKNVRETLEFLVNQVLETDITGVVRSWIRAGA
jgi:hypothetical protein